MMRRNDDGGKERGSRAPRWRESGVKKETARDAYMYKHRLVSEELTALCTQISLFVRACLLL